MILDTNVFYNFLFETPLTDKATKIFELGAQFFIPFIVVNESMFIICRKIAEKQFDIKSSRAFKEFVAKNGYEQFTNGLEKFFNLLDDFDITVLNDNQSVDEVRELMEKYRILSNDALIAATCKQYGINKIATFDSDFDRVDFLEKVEIS